MPPRRQSPATPAETKVNTPVAVHYTRVSYVGDRGRAGNNRGEFLSPEIQADPARALCQYKGWTLDEDLGAACADLDESAFRKNWKKRPGLTALLKAAEARRFDWLICYSINRLARRVYEFLEIVEAFRAAGVNVYFIRESIDTSNYMGETMMVVAAAFAQMEARSLQEWARASIRNKADRGIPSGHLPAWLTRDEATGDFRLDPDAAAPFRRMVELRLQHQGFNRIARTLNEEGYRAPRGGAWTQNRIQQNLTGDNLARLWGESAYHLHDGERITLPQAYPALVTPEEAAALRAIGRLLMPPGAKEREPAFSQRRGLAIDTTYLLSGLVNCGECGAKLRSSGSGGTRGSKQPRAYLCQAGRTDRTRHAGGRSILIRADPLEDAVARVVRLALVSPPPPPPRQRPPREKRETRNIGQVQTEIDSLAMLHATGRIELADYDRLAAPLRAEREKLLSRQQQEDAPTLYLAAQESTSTGNVRQVFLATVEKVEAPVFVEGIKHVASTRPSGRRSESDNDRRCARVTLRWSPDGIHRTYIAPMYRAIFEGEREVFPDITEETAAQSRERDRAA